jgi:hypothetical protein
MTVPLLYLKARHQQRRRAGPLSQRRQEVSSRAQENKVRFANRTPGTCQGRADKSLTERFHLFTPAETQLPSRPLLAWNPEL